VGPKVAQVRPRTAGTSTRPWPPHNNPGRRKTLQPQLAPQDVIALVGWLNPWLGRQGSGARVWRRYIKD